MPVYIVVKSFASELHILSDSRDTRAINEVLDELQRRGARIIDVKISISQNRGVITSAYLILYEAEKPIT